MEDTKIVELYLARDEAAIGHTAKKYGDRLRRLAQSIVRDRETAEECENDTYQTAWTSIPPHEPRGWLYAFLARIARQSALDCCRARERLKRRAHIVQLSKEMEQCLPSPDDCQCRLEERELARAINGYLGTLTEEKRAVFLRRYWYLDQIPEIAGRYGMSVSKVKTMLFRLREGLRTYLKEEGYAL